jgi:Mg2+ and Co2+ transporter CorA
VRVTGFLIEKDGSAASADRETVQRLLEKGELLWLDLYRPDADELGMLATVFGIHHSLPSPMPSSSGSARSWRTTTTSPS